MVNNIIMVRCTLSLVSLINEVEGSNFGFIFMSSSWRAYYTLVFNKVNSLNDYHMEGWDQNSKLDAYSHMHHFYLRSTSKKKSAKQERA